MKLARFLPLLLILVLAGLAALLFAETLHQVVLVPLALYLFIISGYLRSLPHLLWWVLLLATMVILIARTFIRMSSTDDAPGNAPPRRPLSRAEEWEQLAALGRRGGYLQRQYKRRVGGLALDILAQQRRVERKTLEGILRSGGLDMPSPLRQHLIESLEATPPAEKPRRSFLFRSGTPAAVPGYPPPDDPILEMLSFLEEELGEEGTQT
jgi:hypothetical protein